MAQDRFLQRVDSLFGMLRLERQPGNVDDIHTLTVDGHLNVHISGVDDQWILFFSEIALPASRRDAGHFCSFLERNLFPKHFPPIVLAYDKPTESVILWSCELMSRVDDAELFQMFDRFFKEAELLWQEVNDSSFASSGAAGSGMSGDTVKEIGSTGSAFLAGSPGKRQGGESLPSGRTPFA